MTILTTSRDVDGRPLSSVHIQHFFHLVACLFMRNGIILPGRLIYSVQVLEQRQIFFLDLPLFLLPLQQITAAAQFTVIVTVGLIQLLSQLFRSACLGTKLILLAPSPACFLPRRATGRALIYIAVAVVCVLLVSVPKELGVGTLHRHHSIHQYVVLKLDVGQAVCA